MGAKYHIRFLFAMGLCSDQRFFCVDPISEALVDPFRILPLGRDLVSIHIARVRVAEQFYFFRPFISRPFWRSIMYDTWPLSSVKNST
jgi:hypothetical protein